jgi:Ricin-type beta-trefoil lectin domain
MAIIIRALARARVACTFGQFVMTIAVAFSSGCASVRPPPPPNVPVPQEFLFGDISNGRFCLQPDSDVQGAAIVLLSCNNTLAQTWRRIELSDGTVQYVNEQTQLCLDARGGASNHTPVQQWTCNNISNEKWEAADYFYFGSVVVFSRVSGTKTHCLDLPGGQLRAGAAVQLFECNNTAAQVWIPPA